MSPLPHAIQRFYERSEWWHRLSFWGRAVLYAAGILTVFLPSSPPVTPLVVALLSVGIELVLWRADCLQGRAEELKRMDEVSDGFGIPLSKTRMASIEVATGDITDLPTLEGLEYHTTEDASPRRALLKLHESSWFSQELSERVGFRVLLTGGILVATGFMFAVVAPFLSERASEVQVFTQVATAIVLSFVSLGLLRRGIELRSFAASAKNTAAKAEKMFDDPNLAESIVLGLLTEYQIARAQAPSHGSQIWRNKNKCLNRTYQKTFPN